MMDMDIMGVPFLVGVGTTIAVELIIFSAAAWSVIIAKA